MQIPRRKFLAAGLTAGAATCARIPLDCATPRLARDIIVYGGTPGGLAAAIAAARAGMKVVVVEPNKHIGGLSTSGINTGETEHMLPWTIGGLADEFYRRLGKHYGQGRPAYEFESSVAEKVYLAMIDEAKVEVRYGAALAEVKRDGATITELALTDGTTLDAAVFIDASYEGDLMAAAKVNYAVGREAKSEFDEEAAGIRFDKVARAARTVDDEGRLLPGISAWAKDLREGNAHRAPMNYNFRLTVAKDPKLQVPIPEPQRYDPGRYALLAQWLRERTARGQSPRLHEVLDLYPRRNGKFEVNNKQAAIISLGHFGGQFDWPDASLARRAELFADHLEYTLGLLKFLRSDDAVPAQMQSEMQALGLHRGEFADNGHLPYQLYVREARRMRGAFVVTQHDVQTDRRKPDAIGLSSHFIDCHHVQRVALSEREFVNEGRIWRLGYAFQIPYRAITPRADECANLLVPVAASFSHVAFCTLRLESVWMIVGHAAGLAAAQAVREARGVQAIDVAKLQARLAEEKQVVAFAQGQPEKCEHLNGPPEF